MKSPNRKKKQNKNSNKPINLVQDPKKHQGLIFLCASLKRDKTENEDVVESFWSLIDGVVNLENFVKVLTGEEVMSIVRDYQDDPARLDAPSRLYYDLRHIPQIKERAELWMYTEAFDLEEALIQGAIDIVEKAVITMKQSDHLHRMLAACLKLLRLTSDWKYQYGFPLEALYTISKKKCKDGTSWLMKLCSKVQERNPQMLEFVRELNVIKDAEKYRNIGELKKKVDKLGVGLVRIEKRLKTYKNVKVERGQEDRFKAHMKSFLFTAKNDIKKLQENLSRLVENVKSLARDLGMDELDDNKSPNTSYFPLMNNFVDYTHKAIEENKKISEKQKKEERRVKERQRREALRKKKAMDRANNIDLVKKLRNKEKKAAHERRAMKKARKRASSSLTEGVELMKQKTPEARMLTPDKMISPRSPLLAARSPLTLYAPSSPINRLRAGTLSALQRNATLGPSTMSPLGEAAKRTIGQNIQKLEKTLTPREKHKRNLSGLGFGIVDAIRFDRRHSRATSRARGSSKLNVPTQLPKKSRSPDFNFQAKRHRRTSSITISISRAPM